MNDIINLRRERKRRKREEDAQRAEANRRLYGRTKGQKMAESRVQKRHEKLMDGHKLSSNDHPENAGGS